MTDKALEAALLPCPFCGIDAHLVYHEAHTHSAPLKALGIPDHLGSCAAECSGCSCGMIFDSKEEAIAAWNRRAPRSALPGEAEVGGLVERLRQRYTADPVPPCPVCGASLTIQSAGGGNATVYGCEDHRPFDLEHYERSRWTQFRTGDEDVLTLLVTLASLQAMQARAEKAERERDEAEEAENDTKDIFWAIYPRYLEMGGEPISTEVARTELAKRADAAEDRVKELEEERDALRSRIEEQRVNFAGLQAVQDALNLILPPAKGGSNG